MPLTRQELDQGNAAFEIASGRVLEFLRGDLNHAYSEAELMGVLSVPDDKYLHPWNGESPTRINSPVLKALVLSARIDARVLDDTVYFAHPDRVNRNRSSST